MSIQLRGARTHNLQDVDLDLPLGQMIVVAGVSGSGKSSLALDTLHAEGRRRLVETLSVRLRALLDQQPRPPLRSLSGLPPTLAITQHRGDAAGPRATVGTLSELQQLLGVVFARLGVQTCPETGEIVRTHSLDQILHELQAHPAGSRLTVCAPLREGETGDHHALLTGLLQEGFARARVNGEIQRIEDVGALDPAAPQHIEAVIDRIKLSPDREERLADALRLAMRVGKGRVVVLVDRSVHSFQTQAWCPGRDTPLPDLRAELLHFSSQPGACEACQGLGVDEAGQSCLVCAGSRLSDVSRALRLDGVGPAALMAMPLSSLSPWLLERAQDLEGVGPELVRRLRFLLDLGLGYLSLDRSADSLARGELQRLRLAGLVARPLRGVLYVLDEPTAGLHPRDTQRLLDCLHELRDQGNSLLVVEHDPLILAGADQIIEVGPQAGHAGGRIVFQGSPEALREADTLTGRWISGRERPPVRGDLGPPNDWLSLHGLSQRNLGIAEVRFPLGRLSVVTGPGGAGKSSLVLDTLLPALKQQPGLAFERLEGQGSLERIVRVGGGSSLRSPRSSVATYAGLWTVLRRLLSMTRDAKVAGFGPGHFSLNRAGGRCGACGGSGMQELESGSLPDLQLPCPVCGGRRFDRATLRVRYKGLNAAELLELSVGEARSLFQAVPKLARVLRELDAVGLGYLPLGQSGPTLSGGEVQRLRIARDLARGQASGALYVLDEPCSGLHPQDVANLVRLLQRLCTQGATVICIALDPVLIAAADWELRLEAGALIHAGAPDA